MREWWWRLRYAARMWWMVPWLPWRDARDCSQAGDYDPAYTPAEMVDEELSYWTE